MRFTTRALAVAALSLMAFQATAGEYAFTLHNRAKGWTINGFYTFQDGRWSKNWLGKGDRIRPGESAAMDWHSDDGDCVVPFRVNWENYGTDEFKLDWCKGVKNVYMLDKGFRSD